MKTPTEKIIKNLKTLINFNTTQNTGDCGDCFLYLEELFQSAGANICLYGSKEAPYALLAKVEGTKKGALLLHCHLDTAPYEMGTSWKVPAEYATERNGRIFGRGALDCKSQAAVWTEIFFSVLRACETEDKAPDRSLVFLAVSDEENGGEQGLGRLLREQPEVLEDVELVLGEGGGFPFPFGDTICYTFQTGECEEDYMSLPDEDPVRSLTRGVQLGYYSERTKEYALADHTEAGRRMDVGALYAGMDAFFDQAPPTDTFFRYGNSLKRILMECLYAQTNAETSCELIPVITPGYSDNRYFRRKGIRTIGFFPLDEGNHLGGIHGANEYVSIRSLELAFSVMQRFVEDNIWKTIE